MNVTVLHVSVWSHGRVQGYIHVSLFDEFRCERVLKQARERRLGLGRLKQQQVQAIGAFLIPNYVCKGFCSCRDIGQTPHEAGVSQLHLHLTAAPLKKRSVLFLPQQLT